LQDLIGGKNLFEGNKNSYLTNGYAGSNTAISLSNGFLNVPEGIYFGSSFTLIAWIKLTQISDNMTFIDFGNGPGLDNVLVQINKYMIMASTYENTTSSGENASTISASISFQLNEWYHLAYVLVQSTGFIYIDGIQVANGSQDTPMEVMRTKNFIGKSSWQGDPNANAIFQDIRIYQGAMSAADILNDFFATERGKKFNLILSIIL